MNAAALEPFLPPVKLVLEASLPSTATVNSALAFLAKAAFTAAMYLTCTASPSAKTPVVPVTVDPLIVNS